MCVKRPKKERGGVSRDYCLHADAITVTQGEMCQSRGVWRGFLFKHTRCPSSRFPDRERSRPVRLVTPEGTVRVDGCKHTRFTELEVSRQGKVSTGPARHTRRYSESGRV